MPSEIGGYRADTPTIADLLGASTVAFEIPSFQRSYTWGRAQIDELFADLFEYDSSWLRGTEKENPYFLGAVVLAGPKVLDGQQRLVTVSILLALLSERLRAAKEDTTEIDRCVFSKEQGGPRRLKLTLQPDDRRAFEEVLQDPTPVADPKSDKPSGLKGRDLDAFKRHPIVVATQRAAAGLDGSSEEPGLLRRAEAAGLDHPKALNGLARRLLYGVWFVTIDATEEVSAFRLFETLNDRGLDLSAADLVKNKIFQQSGPYRADVEGAWRQTLESVRGEIVDFLRHYWTAFYELVRHEQLYEAVRRHIENLSPEQTRDFALALRDAADIYESFIRPASGPWSQTTSDILTRLLAYRARSCRPALLVASQLGEPTFSRLAQAAEVVSVRHTLVGDKNRNVIERTYYELATSLRKNSSDQEMVAILSNIMPKDDEFRDDFATSDVKTPTAGWREILVRINDEKYVGTGETKTSGASRVHVEHLLPLEPSGEALQEAGFTTEENSSAALYARRIGNLTLLAGKKNQMASNSPFSKKLPILKTSKLAMNQPIVTVNGSDRDVWNAEAIESRSREMAEIAVELWAWPPR